MNELIEQLEGNKMIKLEQNTNGSWRLENGSFSGICMSLTALLSWANIEVEHITIEDVDSDWIATDDVKPVVQPRLCETLENVSRLSDEGLELRVLSLLG